MEVFYENEEIIVRKLGRDDFSKGYKDLLSNLTSTGNLNDDIYNEVFSYHENHPKQYNIIVIEDKATAKLIGSGTLIINTDILGRKYGLIEDIVVSKDFQGKGLGKKVVLTLVDIAKNKRCPKINLDCSNENELFYTKCGFHQHGRGYGVYF